MRILWIPLMYSITDFPVNESVIGDFMFHDNSEKYLKDKILILYFIHHLGGRLSRLELSEVFISQEQFEYFIYSQHLNELVEKDLIELIENNERATFHITESGLRTLELFQDRLNPGKLSWAKAHIQEILNHLRTERQLQASWEKLGEHNYLARMEVNENELTLLHIEMSFVNNEQAQTACKAWKDKASELYGALIQQLLDA